MSAPQPPRKRRPLGKPLDWSDADLDRLSAVTPDDIAQAAAWWRQHAPPQLAAVLEATTDDDTAA